MDEELTAGFSEACARCAEVTWGVSEDGHFYCRNCHNVIERTSVGEEQAAPGSTRISTTRRGSRVKRAEGGRQWFVCEGFQFILKAQAEALLKLGVDQRFKDEVLVRLWRLYLQKTHQAYTLTPVRSVSFRLRDPGSDSETGLSSVSGVSSGSGLDFGSGVESWSGPDSQVSISGSAAGTRSAGSVSSVGELSDWSAGSVDSDSYVSVSGRRWRKSLMSMRKTLALLYVALVWSRQKITLCDLLRLVDQGLVPYVNSSECFPDDMKLSSRDGLIFRVQSIPSYSMIHSESKNLIKFLRLPAFPPISLQSPLHPLNLSLRLLMELNLPDQMAQCVELVLSQADLMTSACLTLDPKSHQLPHYELLAAAATIVSMKLLFGLDDKTEWELSSEVSSMKSGKVFSLRRWYRLLQGALLRGKRRSLQHKARKQWVPKKPFYFTQKEKIVTLKRRRVSEQLTSCFKRLSSEGHSDTQSTAQGGGAFHFLWGQSPDADGRSMHHMTLKGGTRTKLAHLLSEENYWHAPFISCRGRGHFSLLKPDLPQMFVWILGLFSLVLDLKPDLLFEAVLRLERTLLQIQKARRRERPGPEPEPRSKRSRRR